MLSRALLSARNSRALLASGARATTTSTVNSSAVANPQEKKGELFQRPIRQEPGKVRLGFIPEEWFTLFYKKTGVTGPYTFFVTFGAYLVSKEIYVMEHEYYNGLSFAILWIAGVKMIGPKLAAYLDKEVDQYEKDWNDGRVAEKQVLSEQIKDEETCQFQAEGQNLLVQAKRENVDLQLEAAYRNRLMTAFTEVAKRLEYQVEKQNIERRITQKNLVDWVVKKVMSSITPDQEKQNIDKCIADLAVLAKA